MMKKKISILGLGVMGSQIAALFSLMNYEVSIWSKIIEEKHLKRIKLNQKLLKKSFNAQEGNIVIIKNLSNLPKKQPVIEALPENLDIKHEILKNLNDYIIEDALFTNSSSYAPLEIHPKATALHFFNPLSFIKLIETTMDLSKLNKNNEYIFDDLGKNGFDIVQVNNNRGFVFNFLFFKYIAMVLNMIEDYNYSFDTIIKIESYGICKADNILNSVDQVGVDTTLAILLNLQEQDNSIKIPKILKKALSKGIYGRKNKTSIKSLFN